MWGGGVIHATTARARTRSIRRMLGATDGSQCADTGAGGRLVVFKGWV